MPTGATQFIHLPGNTLTQSTNEYNALRATALTKIHVAGHHAKAEFNSRYAASIRRPPHSAPYLEPH